MLSMAAVSTRHLGGQSWKCAEGNQRLMIGSFKGERKRQKGPDKQHDFPLPSYQFPSGRITLPLGMTFPGKVGEYTSVANTGKSIE